MTRRELEQRLRFVLREARDMQGCKPWVEARGGRTYVRETGVALRRLITKFSDQQIINITQRVKTK